MSMPKQPKTADAEKPLRKPITRMLSRSGRAFTCDKLGVSYHSLGIDYRITWRTFPKVSKKLALRRIKVSDLTDQQKRQYAWMRAFSHDHGRLPTGKEFAAFFDVSVPSFYALVRILRRIGMITRKLTSWDHLVFRHDRNSQNSHLRGTLLAGEKIQPLRKSPDEPSPSIVWNTAVGGYHPCLVVGDTAWTHLGINAGDYLTIEQRRLPSKGELYVHRDEHDRCSLRTSDGTELGCIRHSGPCVGVVLAVVRRLAAPEGRERTRKHKPLAVRGTRRLSQYEQQAAAKNKKTRRQHAGGQEKP